MRCSQPLSGHSATEDVGDSLKPCSLATGSPTPDLGDGTSQLHSLPMHRSRDYLRGLDLLFKSINGKGGTGSVNQKFPRFPFAHEGLLRSPKINA